VAQKERAILDAARAAFVEHGYEGARIAEIARGAGISEGSIYSYYKAKDDLMQAVLTEFWGQITAGAVRATAGGAVRAAAAGTYAFAQLTALARYHLATVLSNFDFVDLTFALRRRQEGLAASQDQLRGYVAVFDAIVRRGMDRGEICTDVDIWLLRDAFYGTLEYAARTLVRRGKASGSRDAQAVVDHLIAQFVAAHGAPALAAHGSTSAPDAVPNASGLLDRLQAIVERMEKVTSRSQPPMRETVR
jgi:AcrR family transcriptional regulator